MAGRSQVSSPAAAAAPTAAAADSPSPITVNHVPSLAASKIHPSSSSFLHHLHTDPAASHITLAKGPTNVAVRSLSRPRAPSPKKQHASIPLEPAILAPGSSMQPLQSLPHSPDSLARPPLPSASSMSAIPRFGGSSSASSTPLPIMPRRGSNSPISPPASSSSRYHEVSGQDKPRVNRAVSSRPRTAPHPTLSTSSGPVSPELEDIAPLENVASPPQLSHVNSPRQSPSNTSSPAPSETDSCLAPFMLDSDEFADSVAAASGSMTPEDRARSPRAPMNVLGRAGSLVPKKAKKKYPLPSIDGVVAPDAPTWNSFMRSYAHGRFDPNKIPNAPRPTGVLSPPEMPSASSSPGKRSASLSQGMLHHSVGHSPRDVDVLELTQRSQTNAGVDRVPSGSMAPYLSAAHLQSDADISDPQRAQVSEKSSVSSTRGLSVSSGGASSIGSASTNPSSAPSTSASVTSPPGLTSRKTTIAARRAMSTGSTEAEPLSPTSPMNSLREVSSSPQPFDKTQSRPTMSVKDRMRAPAAKGSYSTAAATVRMAASAALLSSADMMPLGLPSPERELLDPLALATDRTGGSDSKMGSASSDPGSSVLASGRGFGRNLRSVHDWARAEIEAAVPFLPPIAASPVGTPLEGPYGTSPDFEGQGRADSPTRPSLLLASTTRHSSSTAPRKAGGIVVSSKIPPASAPLDGASSRSSAAGSSDYFGTAALSSPPPSSSSGKAQRSGVDKPSLRDMSYASFHSSRSSSSKTVTNGSPQVDLDEDDTEDEEEDDGDMMQEADDGMRSEDEPDRAEEAARLERPERRSSMESTAISDPGARRTSLKHEAEETYERLGFLPAPQPPNELLRRRALYRFNILNTASDVNFDRIAHLAKLVFNTKIVLIALTDADTQWHKSESGMGAASASRLNSICSHTLLAKSDEPLVILDTREDWRFANNPNVTGAPHIRFYAGAPLRTSDGFNLGSLCVIDDKPRSEFTPRSRLALKEFAAIAVREMELWRDKIQLRARDRIQNSMESFTRECLEMDVASAEVTSEQAAAKMNQVYDRAAKLVMKTLDVDGCVIFDLTQFEMIEMTTSDGSISKVYRADPYNLGIPDHSQPEDDSLAGDNSIFERSEVFGTIPSLPVLGAAENVDSPGTRQGSLSGSEHEKLSSFLKNHREGRIYEDIVPTWVRQLLPPALKYAMIVPIFNVDKQPFALLCAYTSNQAKQFLEGYELQFLRAIGVVILSAVLKRRMVLADKAKSVLISSVSHELRTPLHGILAAAELLADTPLDSNQVSFLRTVQTCGTSLIETVNHVLDFTKLSGSAKSQSQSVIKHAKVDLASMIEQTVDSCWIGQRARAFSGESDIGSFYAPPASSLMPAAQRGNMTEQLSHVETIVDIGFRQKGWLVRCEKGGLRRVLMNLIGNSLKFTTDGYVQVTLRELPHEPGSRKIPIEMAVIDTGKGIGREFLKDQLFLPFSQENPLQTGTGLGLAIVNSIVRSESVNGKVDVWSSEGVGTEIRISLEVEVDDDSMSEDESSVSSATSTSTRFGQGYTLGLVDFKPQHRGYKLNSEVCATYAQWWGFDTSDDNKVDNSDILLVNEESPIIRDLLVKRKFDKPILILSSVKVMAPGSPADLINKAGGFCSLVFKPVGPIGLRKSLRNATDFLEGRHLSGPASVTSTGSHGYASGYFSAEDSHGVSPRTAHNQQSYSELSDGDRPSMSRESSSKTETGSTVSELSNLHLPLSKQLEMARLGEDGPGVLVRRRSEEDRAKPLHQRPSMAPRGVTYHVPSGARQPSRTGSEAEEGEVSTPGSPTSSISTISLAGGGVMLKAATLPANVARPPRTPRVLVVEDNVINRRVLGAFLRKKGFEYAEAIDGRAGVHAFSDSPANHWDIVLMDISMPVMDGYEATREIRKVEIQRRAEQHTFKSSSPKVPALNEVPRIPPPGKPVLIPPTPVIQSRTKIFALTGLATPDDKRKAFGSGVDGYLVKPVSLASLDLIFKKIGFA